MNRSLNLLSLFSGCGGMDLGFEGDFDVLSSSIDDLVREKSTANSNKWVHFIFNVVMTFSCDFGTE